MSEFANLLNIADVREAAKKRLPKGIFEFIDGGAEDGEAVEANRAAFSTIKMITRRGVDVSERTTETTLLGHKVSMPFAIAPTGAAGLVWYNGELELARAAAAANIPFTLATRSFTSIEDIASLAGGRIWFQLYVWTRRDLSYQLVDRAQAAGFEALLVTLDVPVQPNREYNQRNGFALPFGPNHKNMGDMLLHPRWLLGTMGRYLATTGMPRFENQPGEHRQRVTAAKSANPLRGDNVTWDDIAELRRRWRGPLLIKGILSATDAVKVIELGADGVVVSNHGGRCLDSAAAPMSVLPKIADAIGHRSTLLVDGGVRRGTDIARAIANGAHGVLSGRPCLYGMAIGGQDGARHVIDIFQTEMSTAMGMLGTPTIADITSDLIHPSQL